MSGQQVYAVDGHCTVGRRGGAAEAPAGSSPMVLSFFAIHCGMSLRDARPAAELSCTESQHADRLTHGFAA